VTVKSLIADIRAFGEDIPDDNDDLAVIGQALGAGVDALEEATDWIVATYGDDIEAVAAGAVPYLRLLGITAGGWMMARAGARAAQRLTGNNPDEDKAFLEAKMVSARFFADHILVQAKGLCHTVTRGSAAVGRY
ncbi:MAG: acyl-CoA dehydrogenase C-terminal domain-containing protein, partial [Rhodospirillales bacterium]|nr:acyl-CoA dehydrogenase C-terminal domain-containing protein [Rhodospirillales bacterium]